jgi:hypothetical protein
MAKWRGVRNAIHILGPFVHLATTRNWIQAWRSKALHSSFRWLNRRAPAVCCQRRRASHVQSNTMCQNWCRGHVRIGPPTSLTYTIGCSSSRHPPRIIFQGTRSRRPDVRPCISSAWGAKPNTEVGIIPFRKLGARPSNTAFQSSMTSRTEYLTRNAALYQSR